MRTVVVDDGELNRDCLAMRLADTGLDVAQAWDLPSLAGEVAGRHPVVIVLNIATQDSDALLQMSLDLEPRATVIIMGLAADRDEEIVACAEAGVDGMHLRSESFAHLLSLISDTSDARCRCSPAVSAILMRRVYSFTRTDVNNSTLDDLTPRECEILELIAEGLTNQQIASRLYVTVHTVKNHVHNLLTKLGVNSRFEAVAVLRANRFVPRSRI